MKFMSRKKRGGGDFLFKKNNSLNLGDIFLCGDFIGIFPNGFQRYGKCLKNCRYQGGYINLHEIFGYVVKFIVY